MRNPLLQRIYRRLHRFALRKMNYGQWDPSTSGERFALRYILARCPAEPIIFDVGANIGQYAAEIVAVAPRAHIYCFEPAAAAFTELSKSLRGTPVHAAVGAEPGIAVLRSDKEASIMASLYDRHAIKLDRSEEVAVITIDNFCREHAIDRIDILKLDVEGHELAALQGAAEMLACGNLRFIQFEFGGCNIDSRSYFRDFWELLSPRYDISRILQNGLYRVPFYSELDEIFTTVNFLAERRF